MSFAKKARFLLGWRTRAVRLPLRPVSSASIRLVQSDASGPASIKGRDSVHTDRANASASSSTGSTASQGESLSSIRQRLFVETLKHVKEFGFAPEAVDRAVHSLGFPPTLTALFRDAGDLALYFYADGNRQTREFMSKHLEAVQKGTEPKMKINAFIRTAIVHRLNITRPYAAHWPGAMAAIASRPDYVLTALDRLGEIVDDVWYAAGDRSLDSNWYTKRGLLAAVYKSSELYMISLYRGFGATVAPPDDRVATELIDAFVQRRLDNVMVVGGAIRSAQGALEQTANVGFATVSVIANMLGVQRPRSY